MQPLVTISIPIFKCEEFLERCLQSVLNQTYKNQKYEESLFIRIDFYGSYTVVCPEKRRHIECL